MLGFAIGSMLGAFAVLVFIFFAGTESGLEAGGWIFSAAFMAAGVALIVASLHVT